MQLTCFATLSHLVALCETTLDGMMAACEATFSCAAAGSHIIILCIWESDYTTNNQYMSESFDGTQ